MHQSTTIEPSPADTRARGEQLAAIGDPTSKTDKVESIIDKERPRGPVAKIVQWVPTALVMVALAGVGFVGHETGWRMPKFSELVASGPAAEAAWCEEHGVPEADCIACDADLMPKGKLHGWCKMHGVHECVLEHPETAQLKEPPADTRVDLARAARALALKPRPENDLGCKMHLRRIQFASKKAADRAGIDIGLVDRAPIVETIAANGEITYDPTQVARLSVRSPGTVWRVEKNIGDPVARGDILALVDAAEVGRVKSELLEALVQR
ncbi:MAG: efflux transporter periplasmic adaptor subunit, partial [Pirellulales bacterium]